MLAATTFDDEPNGPKFPAVGQFPIMRAILSEGHLNAARNSSRQGRRM
jgi:hypothetical protein